MDTTGWRVDYALDREAHLKAVFDLPLPGKGMGKRLGGYLRDPDARIPDPEALRGLRADAGLLSLLRSQGVEPRNMVALNEAGGIVMIRHGVRGLDTSMIGIPMEDRCPGHAFLGRGVRLISTGEDVSIRFERRLHDIPVTILSASVGRPFAKVLSHPALVRLPYVVEGFQQLDHQTFIQLGGAVSRRLDD